MHDEMALLCYQLLCLRCSLTSSVALELQEDSEGKVDDTLEWGDEGTSLAGQLKAAYIDACICKHAMLSALYILCKCTLS
jgi:hypothetical protein